MPTLGASPEDGVPDMTVISEIDEYGINTNLKTRYRHNKIYVRGKNDIVCNHHSGLWSVQYSFVGITGLFQCPKILKLTTVMSET